MAEKVLIDREEFRDGKVVEEAEHLKRMFSFPASLCASYLKFIVEQGLLPKYEKWREKKVWEILGE